jgi:hypothetical protein
MKRNRLAEISDYTGKRRKRKTASPHWLSDKTERTNRRQEKDNKNGSEKGRLCWSVKTQGRSGESVVDRELRGMGENP